MESSISVNKHIYQLLIADTQLGELVGNKIYPLVAEETVTYPFIIFTKENALLNKEFEIFQSSIIDDVQIKALLLQLFDGTFLDLSVVDLQLLQRWNVLDR